jgi:hypothetical protein
MIPVNHYYLLIGFAGILFLYPPSLKLTNNSFLNYLISRLANVFKKPFDINAYL